MKKLLLVILGPFVVVAGVAIGLYWWDRGAPPGFRPTPVDVTVDTVSLEHRGVRISGTAHYEVRLKQKAGEETWWVFPLMPEKDTMSRTIRVLVRTRREPNSLYGFEDLVVEGFARPPGRLVPRDARESLLNKGYDFEETYVLIEDWAEAE